jgi:hypothetical protein
VTLPIDSGARGTDTASDNEHSRPPTLWDSNVFSLFGNETFFESSWTLNMHLRLLRKR